MTFLLLVSLELFANHIESVGRWWWFIDDGECDVESDEEMKEKKIHFDLTTVTASGREHEKLPKFYETNGSVFIFIFTILQQQLATPHDLVWKIATCFMLSQPSSHFSITQTQRTTNEKKPWNNTEKMDLFINSVIFQVNEQLLEIKIFKNIKIEWKKF